MLTGLSSFAETNAAPPKVHSLIVPKQSEQKAVVKPKIAGASAEGSVYHRSEISPAQLATIRRVEKEGLFTPQKNNRDLGAMLDSIFSPGNNQAGNAEVGSAIVTIFPPAR